MIKCACKQVYRGSMLVTELYTFNLTCVILLMALYGVALNNLMEKYNPDQISKIALDEHQKIMLLK